MPVSVVERGVAREPDARAGREELAQRDVRGRPVALAEELGRVDLEEPDAPAAGELDRVAVRDEGDGGLRLG